jgi:hypothetical protein
MGRATGHRRQIKGPKGGEKQGGHARGRGGAYESSARGVSDCRQGRVNACASGVVLETVDLLARSRLAELASLLLGRGLDVLLLLEHGEVGELLLGRRVVA